MADNPPDDKKSPQPPLPSSGTTGRIKASTQQLPGAKPTGTGKVVVMLSSVAKPPPAATQQLQPVPKISGPSTSMPTPGAIASPPKVGPISASQTLKRPPPLPPKQSAQPTSNKPGQRLSTTTFVKLPPKTTNPSLVTLTGRPATPAIKTTPVSTPPPVTPPAIEKPKDIAPAAKATPPPFEKPKDPVASKPPATPPPIVKPQEALARSITPPPLPMKKTSQALSRKTGAHLIPPIVLNQPEADAADSIFAPADKSIPTPKPAGWKALEPGELPSPAGGLKNDIFERSQRILPKPEPTPAIVKPVAATPLAATPPPVAQPKSDLKPEPKPEPKVETKVEAKPAPAQTPPKEVPAQPAAKESPAPSTTKDAPAAKQTPAKETSLISPATRSPQPVTVTGPMRPPPLPLAPPKSLDKPAEIPPTHPVQHAPPLQAKTPEPHAEKLRQPHLPPEPKAVEPEKPAAVQKAPALIAPQGALSKPLQPPASMAQTAKEWLKKTAPLVLPSTTTPAPVAETKPALKAPVLPKRFVAKEPEEPTPPVIAKTTPPAEAKAKEPEKKADAPAPSAAKPPPLPVASKTPAPAAKEPAPALPADKKEPVKLPASAPGSITAPLLEKAAAKETPAEKKEPAKTTPPVVEKATPTPSMLPAATAKDKPETVPPLKTDSAPPPTLKTMTVVPSALTATKLAATTAAGAAAAAATAAALTSEKAKATSPLISKLPERDKNKTSAPIVPGKPASNTTAFPASVPDKKETKLPPTRAERAKRRRLVEVIVFWVVLMPLTIAGLILASLYFGRETRVEGQVVPPPGMALANEIWIVTDFTSYASGIAEDLAAERTPIQQEIQERQEHVQRAQADVAAREERLRLINEEIQASKDEIASVVKQSRDATQQIWDGEGASIDNEYQSKINDLKRSIADRAKANNLKYNPDETYQSPEVWANAYRLALYEVPAGVDSVKEHQWLGEQMKQWRAEQKTLDDRKEALREKAAQLKLAPAPKIADLNNKIEDLQGRADSTKAEEVPLKSELQQAQADLVLAQAADANLDDKYYKELNSLPDGSIVNHIRIPIRDNGRFSWVDDNTFVEGEKEHNYYIFSRAIRPDGRQYWSLHRFSIKKDQRIELFFEPTGYVSTKAILRPNLAPDEQEQ